MAEDHQLAQTIGEENQRFSSYESVYHSSLHKIASLIENGELETTKEAIESSFPIMIEPDGLGGFEITPIVKSLTLRRVLNEYGVIEIEGRIYQVLSDRILQADKIDVADFKDLSSTSNVKVSYIDVQSPLTEAVLEGICTDEYRYNGSDHRLKPRWYSEVFEIGGVHFKDVWIEIKHQKKGAGGIWYANEEDEITCDGNMVIYQSLADPPINYSVSARRTNTNILEETIENDRPVGYPLNSNPSQWVMTGSSVSHSSRDGNASAGCTITK